ncbi:MAG: hypothetical protein ACPIOQ_46360, partial [Promethearchaeia archaeon]
MACLPISFFLRKSQSLQLRPATTTVCESKTRGAEGGPASERVASSASLPEGIHWVSAGPEALGLAGMWSSKRHMVAVSRTHTASPGP